MPLFSQQGYQSFRKTVRTEITLGSNRITANEGETVVLTLTTRNVRSGTQFYYTVTGVAQEDLSSGSLSGTTAVISGSATITFTLANDVTFLEGPETLTVTLYRVVGGVTNGVPQGLDTITGVDPITVPVEDTSRIDPGEIIFTSSISDNYQWVVPQGVSRISMVCIGSGGRGATWRYLSSYYSGGGGGGGGLGYKNNVAVTPGEILIINVGNIASLYVTNTTSSVSRQDGTLLCAGYGGGNAPSNTRGSGPGGMFFGDGGGRGGVGGYNYQATNSGGGGGGAGGYSGAGGRGGGWANQSGTWRLFSGTSGAGGGGAGGNTGNNTAQFVRGGAGGGGVGHSGEGVSGSSTTTSYRGGRGGSGGAAGSDGDTTRAGQGGSFGGGGGGGAGGGLTYTRAYGAGMPGVVRIIWPGDRRRFPSTNVGQL
jgi:hypothetical protein